MENNVNRFGYRLTVVIATISGFSLFCRPVPETFLDSVAQDYVLLGLALASKDSGYIESYYGPEEWSLNATETFSTLASIGYESQQALKRLDSFEPKTNLNRQRLHFLRKQLKALNQRVAFKQGAHMSFDTETKSFYGGIAETWNEVELASKLNGLDQLLQGHGSLLSRYQQHQQSYAVPREKVAIVFQAAVEECRRRTISHIELPSQESYELQLVKGKPWSAYSWYQGNYKSLVQLNVGFSLTIDSMIDLACHELYPGHHTMQTLIDSKSVQKLGWLEYTLMPIPSPFSAFSEGLAIVGTELIFPLKERQTFEKTVLFPLAGLDIKDFQHYDAVRRESKKLRASNIEIARRYFDQNLTRQEVVSWFQKYALVSHSAPALMFLHNYRSHIASYEVGERMVREILELQSGNRAAQKWKLFAKILISGVKPHH